MAHVHTPLLSARPALMRVRACMLVWMRRAPSQVSTSNAIVAEEVHIETDAPIVWTTQLHVRAPEAAPPGAAEP